MSSALKKDKIGELAIALARSCADDKCGNVVVLDLRGLSSITDYFVIATGTSDRQIRSVADHLLGIGKEMKIRPMGVDGKTFGHWVLIDFVDVVVHVFSPDYRELYDLELLWGDAPRVEWDRPAEIEAKG